MSDRELLIILHSSGQFVWDNGSPIYIGGCPKMAFFKRSIMFSQLVQKVHDLSNGIKLGHVPIIQYFLQNGKVCTLVAITNDEDVETMFRAPAVDASAVYLYIQSNAVHTIDHQSNEHRMRSTKVERSSSSHSILGKRDAARPAKDHQDINTNMNITEEMNLDITLPSPKVNPIMKGHAFGERKTVIKSLFLPQPCPSVDLGADSEMVFSSGEDQWKETDVGIVLDNKNLDALHVDTEICKKGCYPLLHNKDENPTANNDACSLIESDNLDFNHFVIGRRREGDFNLGRGENPCAENRIGLGNDIGNLDFLYILSDSYIQGPTGYGQGIYMHIDNGIEKIQTRCATSLYQYKPSKYEEADHVHTDITVPVTVRAVPDLTKASIMINTMHAADEMPSTPPHEESAHEIWKGRVFSCRDAFKTTLAKFAMYKNFCLKPLRSNRFEATARCSHPTCPWRIHASIVESGPQFQVKTYNREHKCTGPLNGTNYPQATSGLIADFIRDRLRVHQDYRPEEIMSDFQREFGVQISYRKAHIAKEIGMTQIRGSFEDLYKILSNYRLELKRTNSGTVDNLWTGDDHSFQRYYVCFGGIRPLISLDGTHLRGEYPGSLLIVVCQDGDHGLFPLAFAIVESECYGTWSWFLANLDLTMEQVQNLTIVSDRMKGLTNAVKDVISTAKHCYCSHHISQNIQAKFKNDGIIMKFWCAVRSTCICEFDTYMAEILAIDVGAHDYINNGHKQLAERY